MWNFRYYAHCIELNCNFTIWLKVTVNSPFRRINLGSTPVTGGVTQTNKADKRSQRQAVTALYYYHTPPRPVPTLPKPHHPLLAPPHLPPLLKVRCCRLKKFGRLPEGLSLHQPFQNSTIPLAFRRARACVCLYGFVFALPHRFPYCNRLYALICFHIRTIPCFAPPHLPPLLKVRCCRPKKFVRLPEGLSLHQPFQNRTIPLAFRRVRVCVCLYGFASVQNLGHTR